MSLVPAAIRSIWTPALVLALVAAASSVSSATIITVLPDGTGDFPTIQSAVDDAEEGDEIVLGDGTFSGPGNREVDLLGKAIAIRSFSGNSQDCQIDCEGSESTPRRGFLLQSGEGSETILEDLTITGAWAEANGGAILVSGASPTIRRIRFVSCGGAGYGVALYVEDSAYLRIEGCEFADNSGTVVHGGSLLSSAELVIEDCIFRNNPGSAIVNSERGHTTRLVDSEFSGNGLGFESAPEGILQIVRCRFESNVVAGVKVGGEKTHEESEVLFSDFVDNERALFLSGGFAEIRSCAFEGNTPQGALRLSSELRATLSSTVFRDNHSETDGGALSVSGISWAELSDCDFIGNSTAGSGGAINDTGAGVLAESCLFKENTASDGGAWHKSGYPWEVSEAVGCVFERNRANRGGAIHLPDGVFGVERSTFYANEAELGAHVRTSDDWESVIKLKECILAFGVGESFACFPDDATPTQFEISCTNMYGSTEGDWTNGCVEEFLGLNGNLETDPLLCDPENGDLSLQANSPCMSHNTGKDCGTFGAFPDPGCLIPNISVLDPKNRLKSTERERDFLQAPSVEVGANPWRTGGVIEWSGIGWSSTVASIPVRVFSIAGRQVATLDGVSDGMGRVRAEWHRMDAGGSRVPSGIYYAFLGSRIAAPVARVVVVGQ